MIVGDMDAPATIETYTVPETAEAFGRSVATIRRWIEAEKIPAPYLRDLARNYSIYSRGELEVMARIIAAHEQEFNYLVSHHNPVIETLQQAVSAYRSQFL